MTTPPTMNLRRRFMVAGTSRPARTAGGLRQTLVAPIRPILALGAPSRGGRGSASRRSARRPRGRRQRRRSPSCRRSRFGLRLEAQHAGAPGDEVHIEQRERREVHQERCDDDVRHRPGPRLHRGRRLVQGAPPIDREVHERNVERGDDAEHGREPGAALAVLDHPAEQQVAEVHDEEDRDACEPRVPGPPGAPRRLSPDRARGDRESGEEHAHFGRGVGEPVRGLGPPHEIDDRGDEDHPEREVRDPDARYVEIHDALDVALGRLARRDCESHHEPRDEPRERHAAEKTSHARSQASSTKSNVSTPTATYTTSAAARSLSQWATLPRVSPSSTASVALTVASSTGASTGSRSTGNRSPRARTCAVIAAKSVPTAASATVPSAITTARPGSTFARSRLKKKPKSTRRIASMASISSRLPASLPT